MKKWLWSGLLLLFTIITFANPTGEPMPADQAFTTSAKLFGNDTVVLDWKIAPKHYLYRDRFHFKILQPANTSIGHILYPPGHPKHDEIFGNYEVYTDQLSLPLPMMSGNPHDTLLQVNFQGCSEDGYCYPPITQQYRIDFSSHSIIAMPNVDQPPTVTSKTTPSQAQPFLDLFSQGHFLTLLLAFFGFGVLLSFTPCVLPMIPILSGIIIGHQKTMMAGKTFRLSLVYVLSMAVTYAIAGMLVGWMGGSIQAVFQKPWVIALFSLLFVLLALSFFGLYSIKLPAKFEERISHLSHHQKSGHYLGVAIMGCLATLIVSPCVTPALVGVLGYISSTGNAAIGGAALFVLGLGMGVPLLAVGLAGGKLLPKAGAWMRTLEHLFGVLFLGLAIWMLNRIIPPALTLFLWAILFIGCAIFMGALSGTPSQGWGKLWKSLGFVLLIYGILLIIGAAQGNGNPLQPLTIAYGNLENNRHSAAIITVKNLAEVQTVVNHAKAENKPVLLDFYAAWCSSCRAMAHHTFTDPEVKQALTRFVVLKADVTANNAADKALMNYFSVIAPPSFIRFDGQGVWQKDLTRVGEMDAKEFLTYLQTQ